MSDPDDGDAGVVVGEIHPTMVRKHIKKSALRNKSLSVSFDEKNLKDFVTGFHKRKKKRRKEAQRQLQEKARLKRLEARKQRKVEREMALHDGNINEDPEPNDVNGDGEEEGADTTASVSETKTYETGDTTIRVTTSELPRDDDDDFRLVRQIPKLSSNIQMKPLPVKKKQLKRTSGRQSHKTGKGVFRKKEKRKSKVKW